MGIQDRIKEIEDEMARTQKNKKTEYHLGLLKGRIAKLKQELMAPKTTQKQEGFEVVKTGDARVTLIGFPSVGKSTLLTKITGTESVAADYEFTTLDCISGKMNVNGATIQILDLPGIIKDASKGKGKGRQVISVARTSDLILMVLDPRRKYDKNILTNELENMNIRLNKTRPDVSLTVTESGGININSNKLSKLSENEIKAILQAYKINNCILIIREDITDQDLIDVVSKNVFYIKCLYCYNKVDELSLGQLNELDKENSVFISSQEEWNLEGLKQEIYEKLSLKRIYTKKKGEKPDFDNPLVLKDRHTVLDLCLELHRDFQDLFKFGLVWGASAKHNPQKVGLSHVLCDEDVIQLHLN